MVLLFMSVGYYDAVCTGTLSMNGAWAPINIL
jgi:hypothetical protein